MLLTRLLISSKNTHRLKRLICASFIQPNIINTCLQADQPSPFTLYYTTSQTNHTSNQANNSSSSSSKPKTSNPPNQSLLRHLPNLISSARIVSSFGVSYL